MGGELMVESQPGAGSEFAFTLPLEGLHAAASGSAPLSRFNHQRVLVVDDNSTNLRLLDTMLRQMGLMPSCVDNAGEALRRAAEGPPWPLILLDAQMPDMDGVSLALELSALPEARQSQIIMLSSMSRHFDANMLKRIGIAHYLHKPVAQRELHQVIAGILVPTPVATTAPAPVAVPVRAQAGLHILLAEDNLVNQKVARRLLEQLGHRCEVVNNGREALERWRAACWDLLLIDLQMPEMDGETAIRLLREETLARGREHQPAMAMTAHAMQGDRERCLAMGFDDYIAKPVSQEALREAIARVGAAEDSGLEEEKGLPDEAHLLKQCADDPELVEELLGLFAEGLDAATSPSPTPLTLMTGRRCAVPPTSCAARRSPSAFNALPGCSSSWRARRRRPTKPCLTLCATRWLRRSQAATCGCGAERRRLHAKLLSVVDFHPRQPRTNSGLKCFTASPT
jgi:CheY-like chemotaxis protein